MYGHCRKHHGHGGDHWSRVETMSGSHEGGGRFGGRGRGGPFGRHRDGPFGGRGPRMFDPGALRLVVLGLIAEEPRHGYDVIKALEARFQGAYSPSAGAIYPMLQMMEEADLVTSTTTGNKRLYTITDQGLAYLEESRGARQDQRPTRQCFWRDTWCRFGRGNACVELRASLEASQWFADCRKGGSAARNPEKGPPRDRGPLTAPE